MSAPSGGGAPVSMASIDPMRLIKRYYPILILAALFGGGLGVVAHYALLKFYPTYTASVVFLCEGPVQDLLNPNPAEQGQSAQDRFMGTQMGLMTSDQNLTLALQDPDIEKTKWIQQYYVNGRLQPNIAVRGLGQSLNARLIPMSNLIRLSLSWREPVDTATVVNAVANTYMDDVRRGIRTDSVAKRDAMSQRLRAISDEIARSTNSRSRLLAENNVTDLAGSQSLQDTQIGLLSDKLIQISQGIATASSMLNKMETQSKTTATINYSDDIVEEAKHDPIVQGFMQDLASLAVEERVMINSGYGEEHESLKLLRRRIVAVQQEHDDALEKAKARLFDSELDRLRSQTAALREQEASLIKERDDAAKKKEDLLKVRLEVEQINDDIERLVKEQNDLSATMKNLEIVTATSSFDRVKVIRRAQTPDSVTFPKLRILLPAGVFLMTALVAGLIVLRELLDQRVRGPADLSMIPRLRVLGMVPDAAEVPSRPAVLETAFREDPTGVLSESVRQLRSPIAKRMDQERYKSLVVIGGMPGSGATTVACNLALSFSGSDERVLLIDANLRRPGVHRAFKLPEGPGLGEVLAGRAVFEQAVQSAGNGHLFVLTAGAPAERGLPERLSSEAMSRLLAEAGSRFDRVIIDAPPAIVSGDGVAIANRCDAVVLVVRAMQEKRGLVNRLRVQLSETRAELLGVVVNAVRASAGGYLKRNMQATHAYQTRAG